MFPESRRRRHSVHLMVAIAVACGLLTLTSEQSKAVTGADWRAGNIISDANFFDAASMSESAIGSFLDSKGASCAAGAMPCLKDYTTSTPATPAESGLCSAITAQSAATAENIIFRVANACGISPKVILVMIQKESSLVTRSQPSTTNYQIATGFACPDTAPCDAQYFGFFNQVYRMARQFKVYSTNPTRYGYQKGRVNSILYNPNASCGSGSVYIENQATANLYIYTPYQPNAAALANLYGTGDSCSAYGNRNFWRFYADWFGGPTEQPIDPQGAMQASISSNGTITVSGWAVDMSTPYTAVNVMVTVNGEQGAFLAANGPRPELASYGIPGNHGFVTSFQQRDIGNNNICLYVFNTGLGTSKYVQCLDIAVPLNPKGTLEVSTSPSGYIQTSGWAYDPSYPSQSANVLLTVNGAVQGIYAATGPRPELASYGIPGNHGFSAGFQGPGTDSDVCLFVFNSGGGSDVLADCRRSVIPASNPQGYLNASMTEAGVVTVDGYAFDLNAPNAPVNVMFTVNGQVTLIVTANGPRPELAYYGIPGNHGFNTSFASPAGTDIQLCAYGFNIGPGANVPMWCQRVRPPQIDPRAAMAVYKVGDQIGIDGWAFDLSFPANPLNVMITVDGQYAGLFLANGPRPELAQWGIPGNHGFATRLSKGSGTKQVCLYAFNQGGGKDVLAQCAKVTI